MKTSHKKTKLTATNHSGKLLVLAFSIASVTLGPFIFILIGSFKTSEDLYTNPTWHLPTTWSIENYSAALRVEFFRGLINSLLIVSVTLLMVVLISAAAAFAFARLDFKINTLIFTSVLACLIVPQHTTLIPIYTLTSKLKLYDTLYALIGPYVAFSIPVTIFILTQFMKDVPKELFESAIIDGASHGRVFFYVYLGVAKGAMATVAIFNAITLWNEFLFAYMLTGRPETRTLPLTVFDFQGQYTSNIPAILASLSLATIPLFLAYLFFQEQLVKGVLAGAVKS